MSKEKLEFLLEHIQRGINAIQKVCQNETTCSLNALETYGELSILKGFIGEELKMGVKE